MVREIIGNIRLSMAGGLAKNDGKNSLCSGFMQKA